MIKNSIVNGLGLTVPILAAILCIPPLFAALGEVQAGLLLIIWAIVNSSALLDFGLGRALTFHLAKSRNDEASYHMVGVAFWLAVVIGTGFGALLFLFSGSVAAHLGDAANALAFQAIAWSAPFIIATSVLRGILEAKRQFLLINAIRIPTGTLNFVAPLLVVWLLRPDNELIAWSLTLGRILTFFLFLFFARRSAPYSLWRIKSMSGSAMLVTSGGWMTISNMAGPALNLVERLVIGGQLSLSFVTTYAMPQEIVSRLSIIPNAISIALFPELANNLLDRTELSRIYVNCLGAVLVLIAAPTLAIILFAHEILTLWMGASFAEASSFALQVFAVGGLAGALAQIPFVLIQARGDAKFTGTLHLVEVAVVSLALVVAVASWSLAGALAIWLTRCILDAAALFLRARKFAQLSFGRESASKILLLAVTLACIPLTWTDSLLPRVAALVLVTSLSAVSAIALLRSRTRESI
ncbi:polysaccharide biosynthesis protein [Rhodopseudomonas palustris BisB5]|uniref:Polysaccharide biosynthesis protein n=1 Tax=Rhodopseudomonas palustris (strain BisB5) TaxID=316057 RepID=Q13D51_RHOPS|nr:polysaccharide biosynthesis protein [Rhodopseudomonas palustris BisB5]